MERTFLVLDINPIQIEEYSCVIQSVTTFEPDGIWRKEPELHFRVGFSPYVGSIISTGVSLPVKEYSRYELISLLEKEIRKTIAKLLREDIEKREKRKIDDAEREKLNKYTDGIKSILILG